MAEMRKSKSESKNSPAKKGPGPDAAASEKAATKKAVKDKAAKKALKIAKKQQKLLEKAKKRLAKAHEKLMKKAGKLKKSDEPISISTGKGPTPAELGHLLVKRFNQGKAETKGSLWSDDLISIEGVGVALAWVGMKAVDAKNAGWSSAHRVLGASAEGPFVGATGFAVKFKMDVEEIKTAKRMQMEEVGVYTVEDGKIVLEEFMYRA